MIRRTISNQILIIYINFNLGDTSKFAAVIKCSLITSYTNIFNYYFDLYNQLGLCEMIVTYLH